MLQPFKPLLLASLLLGVAFNPAGAAEREDVRKAINLNVGEDAISRDSLEKSREDGARLART